MLLWLRLHSRLSTLIRTCTPWNRWEIYQLLQKVMLCGLLGFVERGTLTQASLGLVVSETVLLAFMRCAPIMVAPDSAHNVMFLLHGSKLLSDTQ